MSEDTLHHVIRWNVDFSLKQLDADARVRLSSFQGQRPVALIFGSYT